MGNLPPPLTVPLPPEAILRRLDTLSRRGKLAEFRPGIQGSLFEITAFGNPFDHVLVAHAAASEGGTTLTYRLRMLGRIPTIVIIVLVVTIWPGVWLTDSMLRTYWTSYDYATWMWYIPITALPLPWMWVRMVRRSRDAAEKHAAELAEAVRTELSRV